MKRTERFRFAPVGVRPGAVAIAAVVVALGSTTLGSWEWPFGGEVEVAAPRSGRLWIAARSVPQTAPATIAPPAPGELVFHAEAGVGGRYGTAIPRLETRAAVDHENGLRSILALSQPLDVAAIRARGWSLGPGNVTPLGERGEIAIVDRRRGVQVHPYAILPVTPASALSILQDVAFTQEGRRVDAAGIGPGEAVLVVPADVPWVRLPRELIVFRSGRVVARHRFFDRPSIEAIAERDGTLVLHRFETDGRSERFDLETVDFAGNLRRISLRIGTVRP